MNQDAVARVLRAYIEQERQTAAIKSVFASAESLGCWSLGCQLVAERAITLQEATEEEFQAAVVGWVAAQLYAKAANGGE